MHPRPQATPLLCEQSAAQVHFLSQMHAFSWLQRPWDEQSLGQAPRPRFTRRFPGTLMLCVGECVSKSGVVGRGVGCALGCVPRNRTKARHHSTLRDRTIPAQRPSPQVTLIEFCLGVKKPLTN